MTPAVGFIVVGFLLSVTGIALLSVPWACIIAGVVLFVAGGLEARQQAQGGIPKPEGMRDRSFSGNVARKFPAQKDVTR